MNKLIALILLTLNLLSVSFAQNKLTDFTEATSLNNSDLFYLVVSNADRKLTWQTINNTISTNVGGYSNLVLKTIGSSNVMRGSYIFDGLSSVLTYGSLTGVVGSKWLLPAKSTITDFRHIGYVGSDGTAQLTFNYGTGSVDTAVTKRLLWTNVGLTIMSNSIVPVTNSVYNLGHTSFRYNYFYADSIINTFYLAADKYQASGPQIYTPSSSSPATGSITFSVALQSKIIRLNISGATTINNFTNGTDGQEIIVHNLHTSTGNLTIAHYASEPSLIKLNGSVNRVLEPGENIHLWYDGDRETWYEVNLNY